MLGTTGPTLVLAAGSDSRAQLQGEGISPKWSIDVDDIQLSGARDMIVDGRNGFVVEGRNPKQFVDAIA